jgi:hypothetical protein
MLPHPRLPRPRLNPIEVQGAEAVSACRGPSTGSQGGTHPPTHKQIPYHRLSHSPSNIKSPQSGQVSTSISPSSGVMALSRFCASSYSSSSSRSRATYRLSRARIPPGRTYCHPTSSLLRRSRSPFAARCAALPPQPRPARPASTSPPVMLSVPNDVSPSSLEVLAEVLFGQ